MFICKVQASWTNPFIAADLTSEILESIQRGDTLGAVDQQAVFAGLLSIQF